MFRVKSPARLIGNQQALLTSKNLRFFFFSVRQLSAVAEVRKTGLATWDLG